MKRSKTHRRSPRSSRRQLVASVFFILAAFTASAMARPIMNEAWTDDPPTTITLQDDQRDHGSPQPVIRGGQAVSDTEQQVVDSIALMFELVAAEPAAAEPAAAEPAAGR